MRCATIARVNKTRRFSRRSKAAVFPVVVLQSTGSRGKQELLRALVTGCCILLVQNNYQDAHWLGPHMTTFFFLHIGKDKAVLIFTPEQ